MPALTPVCFCCRHFCPFRCDDCVEVSLVAPGDAHDAIGVRLQAGQEVAAKQVHKVC